MHPIFLDTLKAWQDRINLQEMNIWTIKFLIFSYKIPFLSRLLLKNGYFHYIEEINQLVVPQFE